MTKVFHASNDILMNSLESTVQPVPAPVSMSNDAITQTNAGGRHQKLMLFNLANAMSTTPIMIGRK